LSQRLESGLLQTAHFRLEKPQVHDGLATVVLAYRLVGPGAGDREDRDPAPVRPSHLDPGKLAAAHEAEGPQE
jgi:hypothetical protein